MLDYWTGKADKSPRKEFFYFSDDGDLVGLRYDNWKFVFMEQREPGTCQIWAEPFVKLRVPKVFNLLTDPYERADITSNTYWDWMFDHVFLLVPAQTYVAQFLSTFREFPPRQKPASFSVEDVIEQMAQGASGGA
jgi:arylsulfatase